MDQNGNRSERDRACNTLLVCTVLTLAGPTLHAQTRIERPGVAAVSTDLGRIQPAAQITLTVHLNMRDQQAFDQAVKDLYTSGSPTYHHWMTNSDIAGHAPTAAAVQSVVNTLKSKGLSVLSVASDNLSIRVRGPASAVESAFQTQLHEFAREGRAFHANVTAAVLAGAAGSLVHGVTGLTNFPMQSYVQYQLDPRTGRPLVVPQSTAGGFSGLTDDCFGEPATVTLPTNGAALPYCTYSGNTINNPTISGLTCAWTPAQLQAHYGLTSVYSQGWDGTGQTVVLVEGPVNAAQLQSDLALFSTMAGLPAITSSDFAVLYPDGQPTQLALETLGVGGQGEASLDVQWAHAIAPGAHIVVEIMPSQEWDEFEFAIDYARENTLGNVISNSYGYPEFLFGAYTVQGFEQVLENAAAAGIAVNFASGDSGDNGTGSPNAGGDSYPASSAYVTAVGGTSIGIPNGTANGAEVGWGTNSVYLSDPSGSGQVADPPQHPGGLRQVGSGGGASIFIAKPSWQNSVSGATRQSPDIATLADVDTGVPIVLEGATAVIGGTSLACPIFSAIWAIANQAAGGSPGQAAPLLYALPSTAINDVVPVSSATNVSGFIVDSSGQTNYSSDALFAPLYTTTQYYSVWSETAFGTYTFFTGTTFGTDTSLTVTPGWDNVTGLGVPNGLSFINAVVNANTQ